MSPPMNRTGYTDNTMDWTESLKKTHDTAVIIGSAPNARIDKIAVLEPCLKIAVNGGVDLYESEIWMVFDVDHTMKPSYQLALPVYNGIKLFGIDLAGDADLTFEYEPTLQTCECEPMYPILRGGATIAGCAVQLAYHLGISRVVFVGVDMFGAQYHDGTFNPEPTKNGIWCQCKRMNRLIEAIAHRTRCFKTSGFIECEELG